LVKNLRQRLRGRADSGVFGSVLGTTRATLILVLGVAVFTVPVRGQGNLLLNASFEDPSVGAGVAQAGIPAGWNFSGGSGYLVSDGGNPSLLPATDGSQLYYFFGRSISQGALDLTAGSAYRFTFDLSKFESLPSGGIVATMSDGRDTQSQSFSVSSNAWSSESWDFSASDSGAYVLTLAAGAGTYPAIDRLGLVEYSAVPEPANAAPIAGLFALAAGVAVRMRARRRAAY
jgi:hypothetical protein